MNKYLVSFEGLLMDPHVTKLGLADGVDYQASSTLAASGGIGSKRHTAVVEAGSPKAATDAVANALGADAGKFRGWQVESA